MLTHAQLIELGLTRHAIAHRVAVGRLHRVHRGVYAVGRPELTRQGRWMAAILSCGHGAVLSHESAATLWGIEDRERIITLTFPSRFQSRRADLRVHRRALPDSDRAFHEAIPVTSPARTLLDLATIADARHLETAVNAADKRGLIDPETLRDEIARRRGQLGAPALSELLDRSTFRLTESELERRFLRLVRKAGLSAPETVARVNGFKVDFYWRDLGLVVETDGLRYHRTAAQQARDRERDQAHLAAGLTALRFTHWQVHKDPDSVAALLTKVASRLRSQTSDER